jgi:hypothetical protein
VVYGKYLDRKVCLGLEEAKTVQSEIFLLDLKSCNFEAKLHYDRVSELSFEGFIKLLGSIASIELLFFDDGNTGFFGSFLMSFHMILEGFFIRLGKV